MLNSVIPHISPLPIPPPLVWHLQISHSHQFRHTIGQADLRWDGFTLLYNLICTQGAPSFRVGTHDHHVYCYSNNVMHMSITQSLPETAPGPMINTREIIPCIQESVIILCSPQN